MKFKILSSLMLLLMSAAGLRAACVEITCPADIVTACTSSNGAPVNFAPQASTTCSTTIEVACQPPSGTVFPIGTNLVTCAVTDPRGNMERCQFLVIVTNAPPVIECPDDIYAECQSPNGATVSFDAVASAGCDAPVNIVCIPPSGSVFPIGTNFVACAATDEFGRMDRCTFRVIVTNAPPKITCPPPITLTVGTNCRAVLPLLPVSVIERCTASNQLTFAQFPLAGTLLALGDHTVTVWVSEGNHLDASCTVDVHVIDAIPPKLACPGSVKAYCAPEGTNVSFNVTASDNCDGPVTVTCEPPSGSFFPNGSTMVTCTATDSAGNSDQCTFGINVMSGPPTLTYIAGSKDNYALPADPTSKSACLVTAMTGIPTISEFDQNFSGRWLGHSFENLPGGIQSATLRIHMKPKGNPSSNDVLRIGLTNCVVGAQWAWSAPIKSLPLMGGVWTTNGDTYITLDLAAMPGSPAALLPLLDLDQTHRLDIAVGEDTVVDWFELKVTTCEASGAAGGVPYMLKQGEAIPGPDDSIEFSSDGRTPFDVDLNLGKAEGVVIELGDDWPGATNPPISECTTPLSSLQPMKLEWKPDGELLCTVQFMYDIVPDFVDVLLTQPTNISGGRAIEVWRDGQMVSRYFHEAGSGPIDASGVVLPHDACVLSMGFGIGDFFMALQEEVPVSFAFAKHVSGEESPVMGDFIRLIFNVPMTVSEGGRVRFDPDIVLNIQGTELNARAIKVRKFGAWWEGIGSEVMTVSDGLVVNPGLGNDVFGACFEPGPAYGSDTYSESVMLNMSDLLNCQGCGPGTVFTIDATAQRMYSPPERKTIGTLTCEILTTNPLKTRFTADFTSVASSTEVLAFYYGSNGFDFDTFPSNQVVEVDGAPEAIELFIANTYAKFGLKFPNPPGGTALVDGTPYETAHTISFGARAQISAHEAPYKFCINAVQRIRLELFSVSPVPPSPAPAPGDCVTITCPSNVLARCQTSEGAVAHFEVVASTSCGTNVTVVCVPPSGSLFAPGVTYVGCQANDDLGYTASCRFPVTVAGQCAPNREWVPLLNGAAEGAPVFVEVLQATPTDTEVEIRVPGFWTETDVYGGREFSRIEFPEAEVRGVGFPTKPGERGWFDFPERQNQVRRAPSRFTQAAAINFSRPAFPERALGQMPTTAAEMQQLGIDPRGAQPGLCRVGFSLAASPLNTPAEFHVTTLESEQMPHALAHPVMPAGFQGQDVAEPVSRGYASPELIDQTYYEDARGHFGDLDPALSAAQSAGRVALLPLSQPLFRLTSPSAGEFMARTRLRISHPKGTENFSRRVAWDAWMAMPNAVNGAGIVESLNLRGIEPLALRAAHYLIITPQAARPALEEFAQWKRKKGLHVDFAIVRDMVGGEGDVDPKSSAIDDYIEDYYYEHSEEGVFVLLVGNVGAVPSGYFFTSAGPFGFDLRSDHVYETLGPWVVPALSVGRLSYDPFDSQAALQRQLQKILTYERDPAVGFWPKSVTLCANKENYPSSFTGNVLSIAGYDDYVDPPWFHLLLAGSPEPLLVGTTPKLLWEINNGRGMVLYRGHGGAGSWGNGWDADDNEFLASDLTHLSNSITPIVASIACRTAGIDAGFGGCLGERFMRHPQGAVAFYGATANTWHGENNRRAKALFRAVYEFGEPHLGRALNLVDEITGAQEDLSVWLENSFAYLLLGDPEMTIRRKPVSAGVDLEVGTSEVAGGTILVVSNKGDEPLPGFFINITLANGRQTNGFTGPDGKLFLEGLSPDKFIGLDIMGDGMPPVFVVVNAPALTPVGFESGGFGVMVHGIAGGHYEVEGSSDLSNWSGVGAGVAGPDGSLHIVDPQATSTGHRFYRARVVPQN